MKQITVPVNELIFSDIPQDDERSEEIEKGSPERNNPILIIKRPSSLSLPDSYKYVIVDGNRRAYLNKGENIEALVLKTDDDVKEAKKLIHDTKHTIFRDQIDSLEKLRESIWLHLHMAMGERPFTFRKYRK